MIKTPVPKLVVSKKLATVQVDLAGVAEIMRQLEISDKTIQAVTIYIDNYPHLTIRGSVWPKRLARLRYPRLKNTGSVVRLSSKMLSSGSTNKIINHTLVHEMEHVAQIERKDPKILIGNVTELVFLAGGIGLGLTDNSGPLVFRGLVTIITSLFGLQLGYMLAWHEAQARQVSKKFKLHKKVITNL